MTLTFQGHLTSSVTYVTIPLALCDFLYVLHWNRHWFGCSKDQMHSA